MLPWDRVKGVRVTWYPWRQVTANAIHGRGLSFSYYALDHEQRGQLLQELQEGAFRQLATRDAEHEERRRLRHAARAGPPEA